MFKDKIRLKDIWALIIFGLCYVPALLYRLFSDDVWLCSERKGEARDNGYWMFKYIREKHKEIRCFYVIEKKSCDRKKILKYKNVISYGSLLHYFILIVCKVRLSAHVDSDSPNSRVSNFLDRRGIIKNKRVFLHHGVTKDKTSFTYYSVSHADLTVCSAVPEFDFVKAEFGYPEGNVILTGLARYDGLINRTDSKSILIMPTWRTWLYKLSEGEFVQSDFYKKYSSLINNYDFINFIKNKGYELILYLHPDLQKFSGLFQNGNNLITIANSNEFDIQDLLCSSNLMITDYSSVAFDFSYLKKPVCYFQFDYELYKKYQHGVGYFDYYRDGFGPVFNRVDDVIKFIKNKTQFGCIMDDMYLDRVNGFFKYSDTNNCERIYNEVLKILK